MSEEELTGSGAATSAGIDFQQRVAAWLMVSSLLDLDISPILEQDLGSIEEISFETGKAIDDIEVRCLAAAALFQVKHSLSLSDRLDSEFRKVLFQFAKFYLADPSGNALCVLAVSTKASGKIRRDLKKILMTISLGDVNFTKSPLSKAEREVLDKFRQVCDDVFHEIGGTRLTGC